MEPIKAKQRIAGVTLIEILVVMVIAGIVVSGATLGLGALTRSNLRSACTRIAGAARFGYNRAISHGTTVRMVVDFDKASVGLEETERAITLARDDDERAADAEDGEASAGVDPWAAAQARLQEPMKPSFGASPFGPLRTDEGKVLRRSRPRPLGRGVRVKRMYLPHESEPRESGQGAVYFFPSGRTEHTVVQLQGGETVFSVEIHPLTGQSKVHAEAFEPENQGEEAFGASEMGDRG